MIRSRRSAREFVLRALYAIELNGGNATEILKDPLIIKKIGGPLFEFSKELLEKTWSNHEEFDSYIKVKAINWEFNRLAIVDKLVLRMALCEFLYFEDIPPKVSIDEAIEISKKYSTEKSGKFINGILDSVLSQWKTEKRIVKSGRGLVEGTMKKKKNEPFDPHKSKTEIA